MSQPPDPYGAPTPPPEGNAYGAPVPPPGYGQPAYGQPAYGQPAYGQPTHYGYGALPSGGLNLPPGVELASRGRRVGAYFLGGLLCLVTLVIGYIIWGLIAWGKGTSPAYQVLGMKTWKPIEQTRGSFGTMFMKFGLLQILSSACFIVGIVSFFIFLSDDQRRTLGDKMGSCVVVHDPNKVLG